MSPESVRERPFLEHSQKGGEWNDPWSWSLDQAAQLAAIPPRQLRFWSTELLAAPDVWVDGEQDGGYSSGAVLELRLMRELIDAGAEPWTAKGAVENLADDYSVVADDDPDWTQPRFLDVRGLALRDDWIVTSCDRVYLDALEPNDTAARLVAPSEVDGDDWTEGHGRFRRNGEWWAWPVSEAARELVDQIEYLRRRQGLKRIGRWM